MKTMQIQSTHKPSQGDFVEINESDFDPETMEVYDPNESDGPKPIEKMNQKELAALAAEKGITIPPELAKVGEIREFMTKAIEPK